MTDFHIIPLGEKKHLIETCAAWSFAEWGCMDGTRTLQDVIKGYKESTESEKLPKTWVAICQERAAGMVRLKMEDHPDCKHLFPWLGSLFVHPIFRKRGIADALCKHVEKQAKEIYGFEKIYLFTHTVEALYSQRGWKKIGSLRDPLQLHLEGEALMTKLL